MCNSTQSTSDLGLTDKNHACSCGANDHTSGTSATEAGAAGPIEKAGAIETEYFVDGMTCSHCVASVTEELSAVDGVESVGIDLTVGGASRVTLVTSKPVAIADVRAAVDEAGYSLATV